MDRLRTLGFAAAVVTAIVVLGASRTNAQTLRGVVRDSTSGAPLGGAVVTAIDSAGAVSTRTIAAADGRFNIGNASHAARLRLIRIGYRPREIALPADRGTVIRLAMERIAPLLEAVRVSDRELCPGSADRGAAFQLWEQARAGLLATVVARDAKPAATTVLLFQQTTTPFDDRVQRLVARSKRQTSSRPFVASSAPSFFARNGYMLDGGQLGRVYSAPDADVLLDESFAATHCFHRQPADGEHPGQTGLAFTPTTAEGRDTLVDVRGVIWLDSAVSQLRSLDFLYTSLEPASLAARAGGRIEFRTMPNGISFIERWDLRLPVLDLSPRGWSRATNAPPDTRGDRVSTRQERTDLRVTQIVSSGGIVVDATWSDGTVWRDQQTGVHGMVTQSGSGKPLAHAIVTLAGSSDTTTTGEDGTFILAPVVPGKYSLVIADTTLRDFVPERTRDRTVEVDRAKLTEADAELGSIAAVIEKVCRDIPIDPTTALLTGRIIIGGGIPRDTKVRSRWLAGVTGSSAVLAITNGEQIADVDDRGRFLVCGVARDRKVTLRILAGAQQYTDTTIEVPDVPMASVSWRPAPRAVASVDPGTFVGSVVRAGTRQPIEGAQVTVEQLVASAVGKSATTRADGTFQLSGLAAGHLVVHVRHLGDEQRVDTILVAAGQRVERTFEMQRATLLDTVRATAAREEFISPRMRAFEERRTRGLGHFIDDSLIRKSESRQVAELLSAYIPGLRIITGAAGGRYAMAARGSMIQAVPRTLSDKLEPGCYAAVYFDGGRLYDPTVSGPAEGASTNQQRNANPNTRGGGDGVNLNDYSLTELGAVEFYAGDAETPAQFGNPPCGVLLLWSREK